MAYTPVQMCQATLAGVDTVYYTAAGDTLGRQIVLANTTSSPVTVRLGIAPATGSLGDAYLLIPGVTIPPHDSLDPHWWQVIPAGCRLFASAGTAGVVTLTASGVLIS
jgi:hypothetical protein